MNKLWLVLILGISINVLAQEKSDFLKARWYEKSYTKDDGTIVAPVVKEKIMTRADFKTALEENSEYSEKMGLSQVADEKYTKIVQEQIPDKKDLLTGEVISNLIIKKLVPSNLVEDSESYLEKDNISELETNGIYLIQWVGKPRLDTNGSLIIKSIHEKLISKEKYQELSASVKKKIKIVKTKSIGYIKRKIISPKVDRSGTYTGPIISYNLLPIKESKDKNQEK